MLTLSWPWALFGSKFWFSNVVLRKTYRRCDDVKGDDVSLLLFFIQEHFFAKSALKSSAFSLKSVINLFSWNNSGIRGFFIVYKMLLRGIIVLGEGSVYSVIDYWL